MVPSSPSFVRPSLPCLGILSTGILVGYLISFHILGVSRQVTQSLRSFHPRLPLRRIVFNASLAAPSPWYDPSSAPPAVQAYVRKHTYAGGDCQSAPDAVVVACCRPRCSGLADRVRGLSYALQAARFANRRICLTRDYFLPAPRPNCTDGAFRWITTRDRDSPRSPKTLAGVKYLASNRADGIAELGLKGDTHHSIDMKRVGVLMIAHSHVLDTDMRDAQLAVLSALKLTSKPENSGFVALHLRCGGNTFTNMDNVSMRCLPYSDGHRGVIGNLVLQQVKRIPRDMICKRKLYLASDSQRLRTEVQLSLPIGMQAVACCSVPLHVDYMEASHDGNQHLIDLAAFSMAKKLFITEGGYGELGAVWGFWDGTPVRYWNNNSNIHPKLSKDNNKVAAAGFFKDLLHEMQCSGAHVKTE